MIFKNFSILEMGYRVHLICEKMLRCMIMQKSSLKRKNMLRIETNDMAIYQLYYPEVKLYTK